MSGKRSDDAKARRRVDYGVEPDDQFDLFGEVAEEHPQTRHYTFSPAAQKARKHGQLVAHHIDFDPYDDTKTGTKMTMFVAKCVEISQGADRNDIQTLWDCFGAYLELCASWNVRPSNMNCYLACGIDKGTALAWSNGESKRQDPEYRKFADTIRAVCSGVRNQLAIENKINPVLAIWWDKTIDGVYEQPDAAAADNTPLLGETLTPQELADKYDDLPDD